MSPWKKISALFILVAPLGIFASACAVDATGAADPASTAETDDAVSVDPTPLSSEADHGDRGDHGDRDRDHGRDRDIRRCTSRCYEDFFDCQRHFGGGGWGRDDRGRCHWRFNQCLDHCRYDH